MKTYKAISIEKGQNNQIIATTKAPGQFKNMSKENFETALKNYTWQSFIIIEII